jgi:TPR repeat protein
MDGDQSEWKIARRNPRTNATTTFSDAFEAINSLTFKNTSGSGPKAFPFEFKPDYVRSIYGKKNSIFPGGWWVSGAGEDIDPKASLTGNSKIHFSAINHSANESNVTPSTDDSSDYTKRWIGLAENLGDPFPKFVGGACLIKSNPKRALEFLEYAAEKGEPEALFFLGRSYFTGTSGVERDIENGRRLLQEAGNNGMPSAFALLARLEASIRNAYVAVLFAKNASELADPEGLFLMGYFYSNGFGGLPKDDKKAAEYWTKATQLGHAEAFCSLGHAYRSGHGVTADSDRAIRLFEEGHKLGDLCSTYFLAESYRYGEGSLDKDHKRALELYQSAADRGNDWALLQVSRAYREGFGDLEVDEEKSLEFLKKAAEAGNSTAMVELADAYAEGDLGLAINEASAEDWYKKAKALGYKLSSSAEKLLKRQSGGN